jgi:hypothetical protein
MPPPLPQHPLSYRHLGLTILRTCAKFVATELPIIGPPIKLTLETYKAVKEEIDRTEQRTTTLQDIREALGLLSDADIEHTAHTIINEQKTVLNRELTAAEEKHIQEALQNVTTDFMPILRRIEIEEAQQREEAEQLAIENKIKQTQEDFAKATVLKRRLHDKLQERDYSTAYELARLIPLSQVDQYLGLAGRI